MFSAFFFSSDIMYVMSETFEQNKIEQEIAELSKQIEQKRNLLESQKGIIEEKEVVREVLGEKIKQVSPVPPASSPAGTTAKPGVGTSYLDSVDPETEAEVNRLLGIVFSKGIEAAISEAERDDAYLMDAFHDALTDKMYEEMRTRGMVK